MANNIFTSLSKHAFRQEETFLNGESYKYEDMEPMKNKIKKWWINWAKFDLIALVLGGMTTYVYVYIKNIYADQTVPLLDIWSNVSAGILGAWVTVRLMDNIIRSREHRHSVRSMLWRNLNFIRSKAQTLLPLFPEYEVTNLKNELMWAKERRDNIEKQLYSSEKQDYRNILSLLESLISDVEQCLFTRHKVRDLEGSIDYTLDSFSEIRTRMRLLLDDISSVNKDGSRSVVGEILMLLDNQRNAFSHLEQQKVREYCQKASLADDSDHDLYKYRPRIERIYRSDIPWLGKLNHHYRKLNEQMDARADLLTALTECRRSIEVEPIPLGVKDVLTGLVEYVQLEAAQREKIENEISDLIALIDKARVDITEETDID